MLSSFHRSRFFSMLPAHFPIFNTPSLHLDSFPMFLSQFNPTPLTPFHFIPPSSNHLHITNPFPSNPAPRPQPTNKSSSVKSPRGSKKDHIVIDARRIAFVLTDQLLTSTLHPPGHEEIPTVPTSHSSFAASCLPLRDRPVLSTHSLTHPLPYVRTYNLHTRQIGRRSHHRKTSPAPPADRVTRSRLALRVWRGGAGRIRG